MKRSSYLKYDETVELGKRGLTIWAYGRTGRYVCRVEINAAGIKVSSGKRGGKCLANVSWESFVKNFTT